MAEAAAEDEDSDGEDDEDIVGSGEIPIIPIRWNQSLVSRTQVQSMVPHMLSQILRKRNPTWRMFCRTLNRKSRGSNEG